MASNKKSVNPLLAPAVSGFSLSQSFGAQAAVLVPTSSTASTGLAPPPVAPVTSSPAEAAATFKSPGLSPMGPPVLKPPPAGVFLLPPRGAAPSTPGPLGPPPTIGLSPALTGHSLGPPPSLSPALGPPLSSSPGLSTTPGQPLGPPPSSSFSTGTFSTVSQGPVKRSPYVPPPGIKSSASANILSTSATTLSTSPATMHPSASFPSFQMNDALASSDDPTLQQFNNSFYASSAAQSHPHASSDWMNNSQMPGTPYPQPTIVRNPAAPMLYNPEARNPVSVPEVAYHWFYKIRVQQGYNPLLMIQTPAVQEMWKPFTMIDSGAIEEIFQLNPNTDELVPTDGGRFDVNIKDRTKTPVYWKDEQNETMEIRRCSWFYKSNADGRWIPFDEDLSSRLEIEYVSGVETGRWNRRLEIGNGEYIMMHSEAIIVHFPTMRSTLSGAVDDWGQVQPPTDPALKPREVHRGLEGLPDIPDGESSFIDHLVFIVHGIGSACDMKFRNIAEVVDGFRDLAGDMSEKHFQSAHLLGRANRIEFLPVNWHRTLHGEDAGTDERLKPLTLRSIPKLRSFINETLLDILFYTSPIYCQTIINTVVSEINRMYTLFMARNENFKGQVSVIGHSLGSLILFDILSHQQTEGFGQPDPKVDNGETTIVPTEMQNLNANPNPTLEEVFAQLEISEFAENFTKEGIDMDALAMCNEEDLKEGGLPLGPRKKLLKYLEERSRVQNGDAISGLEKFQQQSVESDVKYIFGPAGTGQPSVTYPRLEMNFAAFYALGSPLGVFLAVRGIESLGPNFSFPTCPRFFNIFHPFDPIAYRVEGLIKPEYGLTLRPVTIPHHKGRKRMHLELKDTVTKIMSGDIKQKLFDSLASTFNAVYSMAVGNSYDSAGNSVQQAVEKEMEEKAAEADQLDSQNPVNIDSKLNEGRRIDYALQEAPLESFNEYLFALASHLCYWESEDTVLMILKDIYAQLRIVSDDQLTSAPPANQVPYLNAGSGKAPYIQPTTTPILAPAPSSYGATTGPQMSSVSAAPMTMINPADVYDMQAPAPTPLPVQTFPTLAPVPSSVPPPSMPPSGTNPMSGASNLKTRPSYPPAMTNQPAMGMDPTAPPAYDKPVAPPPMTGFVRKN